MRVPPIQERGRNRLGSCVLLGEVPAIVTLDRVVQGEVEVGPGWESEVVLGKLPIQLLASKLAGLVIGPAGLRDADRGIGGGIKELSQCGCVADVLRPVGYGALVVVGL